jgi:hypothetical protein
LPEAQGKACHREAGPVSPNVHFISGLMERKVDFVACDMHSWRKLCIEDDQ